MSTNFTRGRSSLLKIAFRGALALGALTMASAANALPTTATFEFNLPSTGLPSQNPLYRLIATLELEQVGNDVVFTLDPNEANPGFNTTPTPTINDINFVFDLNGQTDPVFNCNTDCLSGPTIKSFAFNSNGNLQSGYDASPAGDILIKFQSSGTETFEVNKISKWKIANTMLSQYTTASATANNKPSPIFGVISVSPKKDLDPSTSNWVAKAYMVPEPTNLALLGIGLIGFVVARRRHTNR